jgi:hypothetical protein
VRRRRPWDQETDLFDAWSESLMCTWPEWLETVEALPPGPVDEGLKQRARAWLSWPGRPAWVAANPPHGVVPDEPWFPLYRMYGHAHGGSRGDVNAP